jgi:hypothetical protein
MKKLLSVLVAALMLLAIPVVLAETGTYPVTIETGVGIGIGIEPQNSCPVIMQEECNEGDDHIDSVCYDVVTFMDDTNCDYECQCNMCGFDGCVDILKDAVLTFGWAGRSYAFEGEMIVFDVTVKDMDGIVQDCVKVYVTLDNGEDPIEAGCILYQEAHEGTVGKFVCHYTVEPLEVEQKENTGYQFRQQMLVAMDVQITQLE